jgi:hypothetical protein
MNDFPYPPAGQAFTFFLQQKNKHTEVLRVPPLGTKTPSVSLPTDIFPWQRRNLGLSVDERIPF